MTKELDGGNPDYDISRRGFVLDPIKEQVYPTTR
jgi:hypothetical protein